MYAPCGRDVNGMPTYEKLNKVFFTSKIYFVFKTCNLMFFLFFLRFYLFSSGADQPGIGRGVKIQDGFPRLFGRTLVFTLVRRVLHHPGRLLRGPQVPHLHRTVHGGGEQQVRVRLAAMRCIENTYFHSVVRIRIYKIGSRNWAGSDLLLKYGFGSGDSDFMSIEIFFTDPLD